MFSKRAWVIFVVITLSVSLNLIGPERDEMIEGAQLSHEILSLPFAGFPPISIENDIAVIENASSYGWTGSGSQNNPIILQDMDIDANGSMFGIYLANITLSIELRNITVWNISSDQLASGVNVLNMTSVSILDSNLSGMNSGLKAIDSKLLVDNCTFIQNSMTGVRTENCLLNINGSNFFNNNNGLSIDDSADAKITWCNFSSNSIGMTLSRADGSDCSNNIIENNSYRGIWVTSSDDVTINGNLFRINFYGLYLDRCDNAEIVNGSHDDTSTAIYMVNSMNSVISSNEVIGSRIYLTSSNENSIINNKVSGTADGISAYISDRNIISYNDVRDCENSGIRMISWCNYNEIFNNTLTSSPYGVYCSNLNNANIYNNTINDALNGIAIGYCSNTKIHQNKVSHSTEDGIQVNGGSGISVFQNELIDNALYGISWISSNSGSISRDRIEGSQTGIEYRDSDDGYIFGVHITDTGHGMTTMGSDRNRIQNSTIIGTTGYGIVLSESSWNTVSNNTIIKCRFQGFKLISSSDNVINNNALAYNNKAKDVFNSSTIQAMDNFPSNEWFKDGRGNYWRDLTGPDDDFDGIVDVPYQLGDSVNYDPYPLTVTEFKLVPSKVLNLSGTVRQDTANVTWSPPIFDGGDVILGYNIYKANSSGKFKIYETLDPDTLSLTDDNVTAGEKYSYQISAFNNVGEGPRTESISLLPDITAPVIEILTPTNGSYVNQEMVHLTWKANDPMKNIIQFKVRLDNGEWIDAGMEKEMEVSVVESGPHMIMVWAVDLAGNHNQTSVEFIIDTIDPVVNILQPINGSWTNSTTAFIEWTMDDIHSGIHHVEVRWDDVYWLDKGQINNITIKNLGEGAHNIYVKVIDKAGNEFIEVLNLSIDLVDPIVWIEYPQTNILVNSSSLWLKWVGFDHQSGSRTYMIRVDDGAWTDLGIVYNTTISLGDEGDHVVQLKLIDRSGNWKIVLLNVTLDKSPPQILSFGPTHGLVNPLSVSIFVELSEVLNPNNLEFSVNEISGKLIWDDANRIFFSPDQELRYGTTYEATISGMDLAGNPLYPFKWTFSTDSRGYVKGRVLDMSNFPVKSAKVTILNTNSTNVDGAGNFILTSLEGNRTITIEAPGFITFTKEIKIIAGETTDIGPIRMKERVDQGMIEGRILDEDGDPLLGVIVTLDTGETATTGDDGLFHFEVEIGNYTISFERDGYKRSVENVWVKKGQTVDLGDIELERSSSNLPPKDEGLELWQMQLLIFLVIVVIGIIIIFYIMRRASSSGTNMGEE